MLAHHESKTQSPMTLTVIVLLCPSFDPLTLSSPRLGFPRPEDKLIVLQGCRDPGQEIKPACGIISEEAVLAGLPLPLAQPLTMA